MAERPDRPVLTGLLALVGVGLVVGLVLGAAALGATRMLGLGEGGESETASGRQSMYLPRPAKTAAPSGPLITLAPGEEPEEPTGTPSESESPKNEITLSAGQTAVSAMEQIDLTGVYPGGEGAILQVERFAGGSWTEFPVSASVSDETFSTYVQTGQAGLNKFRMRDTDTDRLSNVVEVRVG